MRGWERKGVMKKLLLLKEKPNWRLECKNRYPVYDQNGGKMAKINTQFMTKTADEPYPLGPHTYIAHTPPPRVRQSTLFYSTLWCNRWMALWGSPLRFSSLKRLESIFVRHCLHGPGFICNRITFDAVKPFVYTAPIETGTKTGSFWKRSQKWSVFTRSSIKPGTWNIPEHPGTSNNYDNYQKNM